MSAICLSRAREEGSMDVKEQRRAALATIVLVAGRCSEPLDSDLRSRGREVACVLSDAK